MCGASEAEIGEVELCHEGSLTAIREGGVSVGFKHEAEIAVKMLFLCDLLACEDLGESVDSLVAKNLKNILEKVLTNTK